MCIKNEGFWVACASLRFYWPKDEAVEGNWTVPPLKRAE
jgi:hypothetical protein